MGDAQKCSNSASVTFGRLRMRGTARHVCFHSCELSVTVTEAARKKPEGAPIVSHTMQEMWISLQTRTPHARCNTETYGDFTNGSCRRVDYSGLCSRGLCADLFLGLAEGCYGCSCVQSVLREPGHLRLATPSLVLVVLVVVHDVGIEWQLKLVLATGHAVSSRRRAASRGAAQRGAC